ncbi:MAG: ATP-binding protein [Verrucomicrobiota bacterium]|jgi:signal transduction histidine kinase
MMTRRGWAVYGVLAAVWVALIAWQTGEHVRVRKALHDNLIDRGRAKTTACGKLMRSPRFSPGIINRERLEGGLSVLVDTNELRSVELLNNSDEVVASAGPPIKLPPPSDFEGGVYWGDDTAILKYPIELGTNMVAELVIPSAELLSMRTNRLAAAGINPDDRPPFAPDQPPRRVDFRTERPYWMKEEDYRALINTKSAHTFVVVLSAQPVLAAQRDDFWMRVFIAMMGTVAVAGYGLAWRSLVKTSELQLRLVRASEQNLHLKEMNIAAAGLAHETRNPLNIIRGLAQLISKHEEAAPEIRAKSRDIINETDRVTAQLNGFINYSRPREVRRAPTDLGAVAAEVARALNYDLEEKKIQLEVLVESMVIEADEQLLRQALFNLVLNAVQAVPPQGVIRIRASRRTNEEAFIEISDNGPGVPAEHRAEIFKPYFTTHAEGTGLGLAVVQQIVLAHGWEIECLANQPAGALFRISHVKLKMKE